MSKSPLNLTRNQLQQMVPNQRALVALEKLLSQTNEVLPSELQAVQLDAGAALAQSAGALDQISTLASSAMLESSGANAKADHAIAQLQRIADALDLLATLPTVQNDLPAKDELSLLASTPSRPTESPIGTYFDFASRQSVNPANREGRVFYDYNDHSLAYHNDSSDVTVNIGREQLIRVKNNTGSGMVSGQVVYINGSDAGWPTVTLARADNEASYKGTIGMVTSTIAIGGFGYVTTAGVVNGLDTSAFTAGSAIYLSSASAGAFSSTKPLEPNYTVAIGYVTTSNASTGAVYVHIDRDPWYPIADILNASASVVLPTTPTVFVAPTVLRNYGFSYDTGTGVLTFNQNGAYTFAISFNAEPSAANKNIYFYAEEDTGSGWTVFRYSGRRLQLPNATETQVVFPACKYYGVGDKLRFYIWGDATVTLKSTDVPGTTPGTVTVPSFRMMVS